MMLISVRSLCLICFLVCLPLAGMAVTQHPDAPGLLQLETAVREQPQNIELREQLREMLLVAGTERLKERDYRGALALFDKGTELAPEDSRFSLYQGVSWYHLGHHGNAEDALQTARRLGDNSVLSLILLGEVYYATGRLYEAQQIMIEAVEQNPAENNARKLLAKVQRDIDAEQKMTTDYGAHFLITYDDGVHGVVGDKVLDVLEGAYDTLGYVFDFYPETSVSVLLYKRLDFFDLTGSPDWSGGLYDGKIRVPVGGVDQMTLKMQGVLYHEYCHVVIRYLTRGRCPTWLNEGLAVWAEHLRYKQPLSALQKAAENGTLLSFEQLDKPFTALPEGQILLAYEQSGSLVDFLLKRFEWFEMQRLLKMVGDGVEGATAVTAVYEKYGLDFDTLLREWRAELVAGTI